MGRIVKITKDDSVTLGKQKREDTCVRVHTYVPGTYVYLCVRMRTHIRMLGKNMA